MVRLKSTFKENFLPLAHPRYIVLLSDFDGTLVSSLDSFVFSAKKALSLMGFSVEESSLRRWLTKPFDKVVDRLVGPLEDSVRRKLVSKYIEIYNIEGYKYSKPNDGAKYVLERLVGQGVKVAIVTSRTLLCDSIHKTLEHLSLEEYISTVVTARDVSKMKPYPDQHLLALLRLEASPRDALSVGDSPEDVEGSKAAGVRVAAYTRGFYTHEELAKYSPDYMIDDLTQLLPLFEAF